MIDKRFAILSGPSSVGKGPLIAAMRRFHPDLIYAQIPVIKSKESRPKGPRPEEVAVWENPDYFRSKDDILGLEGNPQYLIGDCRGLPQAVDLQKVQETRAKLLLVEIYHTIGAKLMQNKFLTDVEAITIFVSPLGCQEIKDLKEAGVSLEEYLTQIMIHKQLVRARYQGKEVDVKLVSDVLSRARDSLSELKSACKYSHVIVNHDGEGNPNWHRLPGGVFADRPEGEAGRSVSALVRILSDSVTVQVEDWSTLSL
ncbi:MAG: nucleoside/nucleotide kinase family protein [Desulfobaccales bacterium]